MRTWTVIAALVVLIGVATSAGAQVVSYPLYYPAPVVQTTYVQPTTVYRPLLRPRTRVVTPGMVTVYANPAPVVVARPAPIVTTRYRPFLGGTVTRTWYP